MGAELPIGLIRRAVQKGEETLLKKKTYNAAY
jgi:hypothetical protein